MGKKGKKGKKSKQPPPLLAEVEREMFQLHINDITRKLERITAKCVELENSNEDYEKKYKKLDEDRADIITYLKRTLQEKSDEAKHLQEIADKLTLEAVTQQEKFTETVTKMNHEFKVMQEQLTADIKLLTGRLKALEHFRVHQDELMNKFKEQEIQIEEKEKDHRRMLYEVEKKFIIAKDKAMKDMEVRQLQLSSEFEATTQMCIAASTKRAIRENIAVNNELKKLLETTYRLIKDNENLKEQRRHIQIEKELTEEEKNLVMQENAEHLEIITHLAQQYEEAMVQMGQLSYAARRLPEVEEKVQHLRAELSASNQEIQSLKQQLHGAQGIQDQLDRQVADAQIYANTLEAVLDTAANEIKNTIKDTEQPNRSDMTSEEKSFVLEERDSLLETLLDFIRGNLIQFSKLGPKKNLKSTACSAMYMPGNLGLISKIPVAIEKFSTEEESVKKYDSYDQELESPSEISEKGFLRQSSSSSEAGDSSEKQEESSETQIENITEVEPIELKGSSVIKYSSIITHSSSFMKDMSSSIAEQTDSEEFDEILPLQSELTRMSSQVSEISKKSSLRSKSIDLHDGKSEKSMLSQDRSKVRFQDNVSKLLLNKSTK